jgi:hypothetical protein
MARQDMDIKADIIAELEEIRAPHTDASVLDAFMVESVTVQKGRAEITLVFPDDRLEQDREPLNHAIEDRMEDIDGVEALTFLNLSRAQMRARDPLASFGELPAAPALAPPAPAGADVLTLDDLLANLPDEDPPAFEPTPTPASIPLYSGGGCAAGTAEVALAIERPTPAPPAPAKPAKLAPAPAPAPTTAAQIQGRQVTLDLDTYQRLLLAEQELALRPSFAQHQALLAEHRALQARVKALHEAVRAILPD